MSVIKKAIEVKQNLNRPPKTGRNKYDLQYDLENHKSYKPLRTGAFVVAGGLITFFVGKRIVKYLKNKTADNDSSIESQLAQRYDSAMRPSGQAFWFPDDTNMTEFWAVTNEIALKHIDFNKVAKKYEAVTGRTSLKEDIKNEISTTDFAKFLKLIDPNYSPGDDTENKDVYKGWFYVTQKTDYLDDGVLDLIIDGQLEPNVWYSNLLLKGNIGTHVLYGKMYEVKFTNSDKTIWIKGEFVKKMSANEMSKKLNDKILKPLVFTL